MKILFIDDEIVNIKNLANKINSFNLGEIRYALYFLNEEANLILSDEKNILVESGFIREEIKGFEVSDFTKLKDLLNQSLSQYDVVIFDRQLQTEEKNKTGVDLFAECRKHNQNEFFFYLIVSKEARKEGIFYDDLKRIGISKQNYIDNSENSTASLNKELKDRLTYFRDNLFFKDINENNGKITSAIKAQLGNKIDDPEQLSLLSIQSNLDFAFTLMNAESMDTEDIKIFSMIIYWYHLSVELFCEFKKKNDAIINTFNTNLEEAKEIVKAAFFNKERREEPKISIDGFTKLTESYRPTAITKIIAHSNTEKLPFGYQLNWYRDKVIHKDVKFSPNLCNVLFAHLTTALYILKNRGEISFQRIENYLHSVTQKEADNKGANDLRSLLDFIKQM